jgi:hypothetical protein
MMARQWWTKPITIETRNIGRYVTINSTERAAEYMLQDWPGEANGKAFGAAKLMLVDAHKGKATTDEARLAFLAAAEEARIFLFRDN